MNVGMISVGWGEIVALYGAGLSTYTYFAERRRRRFSAEVSLSDGFVTLPVQGPTDMLILSANNPGERTVTMAAYGLLIPGGRQLIFPMPSPFSVKCPFELEPGKEAQVFLEPFDIRRALAEKGHRGTVSIRGFFRDQLGNRYEGRKFKIQI